MGAIFDVEETKGICLIDGKQYEYKGCSSSALNEAKEYYKKFYPIYMGKGTIYSINGVKQNGDEILHFFTKEHVMSERELDEMRIRMDIAEDREQEEPSNEGWLENRCF